MTAENPISPQAVPTVAQGATSQPPAAPAVQPVERKKPGRKPKVQPEPVAPPVSEPVTPLSPPPSADLVPAEGYGPGMYLCIKPCQGAIEYKKGQRYPFESNPSPNNFVKVDA